MARKSAVRLTSEEKRSIAGLTGIFGLRMLGLFLILPVFAVYAHGLKGAAAHPELVGIALGAYGLTQALLQIPFGMASDRLGRKPVITAGLLIFAVGSVVAATATSIEGVLLGRILQGAGAVAAVVIALIADLTREECRPRAMASIGMAIGMAFMISMISAPLLAHWIGVPGIFWLTALLSLLAIGVLYRVVPNPGHESFHGDAEFDWSRLRQVVRDGNLLRLDLGIFAVHTGLTALFVVVPLMLLKQHTPMPPAHQSWLYLVVMLVSFAVMLPLVILAETRYKIKAIFLGAIGLLIAACALLATDNGTLWWTAGTLVVFFTGFNVLEALLPSLVAKYADPRLKGTAIGVYNTSEFIGAFAGGALGGFIYQPALGNTNDVFWAVCGIYVLWLMVALRMDDPQKERRLEAAMASR